MDQPRETFDITPAGFRPEHPNATENIARANKAVEERDHVVYQLADMFRELVLESGGITQVVTTMARHGGWTISEEERQTFVARYRFLNQRRSDLDNELLRAMGGLLRLENRT